MLNNRLFIILLVLVAGIASLSAQGTPYGRFGYGELSAPTFSPGRAMGGIGYGVRDSKMLNPMNPASYSAADSLSFLFDVGAYINVAWFRDGENRATTFAGNIDFIGLKFRIVKGLGLSLGLPPVSSANYSFARSITDENGVSGKEENTGEGGFNKLYLGLGYNLFKNFSLGANVSYFFGNTIYKTTTTLNAPNADGNYLFQKLNIKSVLADFGAQYTLPLTKNNSLVFGVVYSPKMKLGATYRSVKQVGKVVDPDDSVTVTNMGFDYPQTFGGGLTFVRRNKYMIGADAQYQQWSNVRFYDDWENKANKLDKDPAVGASFRDRLRIALGGQYVPNATGRDYFGRVRYRMGAYYSNSYFRINDGAGNLGGTKEFGISAGFGFPLLDNRSALNVAFNYSKVLPERKSLIDEQYFKITISYTMNEVWFKKIRLE